MTNDATLLDAGLAPVGTPDGEAISARRYRHPHLGERPVVRLVGEALAPGEDRALAFLGFTAPETGEPLTAGRRRGLGYPAWALVHDPQRAKTALSAVTGMEKAARLARTRPGAAVELYDAVAAKLPHAHLPSFWEQAGRAFIAGGQAKQAAVMFGRAREAERTYALPVDEETRRAVFLEYAFAGALPVKAIASYVAELALRYEPRPAYEELYELAVRRTLGGLPPWSDLPKQLRKLAKAAGLDVDAEDRRLVETLLAVPSVRSVTAGFWKSYRAALVEAAKRSPELRDALLNLFPTADDLDGWWLDLLGDAGALDDVTSAWLTRQAAHLKRGWRGDSTPDQLLDLVKESAAKLREPVCLEGGGRSWRGNVLDADLLDACLAAGVPVADPSDQAVLRLGSWLRKRRSDLSAIAADPRYARVLRRAVGDFARGDHLEELTDLPVLRPLARDWLIETARAALSGGLADTGAALGRLESGLGGGALTTLDGVREAIEAIDPAVSLRRTLRAGIMDELGWDVLDEAVAELGETAEVEASWPVLTVFTKAKAIAVGPGGRVAEHDLRVPAAADNVTVLYSGGAFRVIWSESYGDARMYWSSTPTEVIELTNWYHWHTLSGGAGYDFLTPDGDRISGRKALHPGGHRSDHGETGRLFWDGGTFWIQPERWKNELRELDPATGQLGRTSLPAFLEDAPLPDGHRWVLDSCSLAPLPEGVRHTPLGTDGDRIGFRVSLGDGDTYRIEGVDGSAAQVAGTRPSALLHLPGTADPLVVAGERTASVHGEDGSQHWSVLTSQIHRKPEGLKGWALGTPLVPPLAYWHFLGPRDPGGSTALRAISEEGVRALLQDAEAGLPEVTHPRLRRGLAGVVCEAADLVRRRDELLARARAVSGGNLDEDALDDALTGLVEYDGWSSDSAPGRQSEIAARFLSGELDAEATLASMPEASLDWTRVLGRLGAVAYRATCAAIAEEHRLALLDLLETWTDSRLAEPGLRRGLVVLPAPAARRDEAGAFIALDLVTDRVGPWQPGKRVFVEYGTAPRTGEITDVTEIPTGWATPDRLRALVATARERGPLAWDAEAVALLSRETGLSGPAAALLLGGLAGLQSWQRSLFSSESRKLLGLKVKEADSGFAELGELTPAQVRDLLDAVMPEDPAQDWDLRSWAARLAAEWTARFGRRVSVPEEAVRAVATLSPRTPAAVLLAALVAPADSPALTRDVETWLAGGEYDVRLARPEGAPVLDQLVVDLALAIPWAYSCLPGGDPVRAGIGAALGLVRQRLAWDGLLLDGGAVQVYEDEELRAMFGAEPYRGRSELTRGAAVDDGLNVVCGSQVFFRPALLGGDARSAVVRAIRPWDGGVGVAEAAARLRSPGYAAMAAAADSLPEGAWEANPLVSAPSLVADVGLGEDASVLYLQLLTLLEPTDRNVRMWNGWTPARHKKAVAVLVEKGLVLAAKRERAGRGVFLPGDWTRAKAPNLPVETWKAPMYELDDAPLRRFLPLRPLPELFAEAWRRVQDGEGPR
ncbi:hypothetical protein [Nonomuraea sp. NPDC046570]|uniref:hypothetical protein n=1 Tax=Nonomuraea sp. NPDC046570 TaxID=3155255 RepID=UPI00340A5F13